MSDYITVRRRYQHGSLISPILPDLIPDRITLKREPLTVSRRHYWKGSPFKEINEVRSDALRPDWWAECLPAEDTSLDAIFEAVCEAMERVWKPDKVHVVFHSSGYDSRILSAAVKRLTEKNGHDWLGAGLLFLGNRWEADGARAILKAQGWDDKHVAMYEDGKTEDHFGPWLDFDDFWRTGSAPINLPGNLWWYLPDWAQSKGLLPADDECQGFAGYWANETWHQWATGGPEGWLKLYPRLYRHIMAALRFKLPMEFPLSHRDVLRYISPAFNLRGDDLRRKVAHHVCPEAKHIPHDGKHDHMWPISKRLQQYVNHTYNRSWYARYLKVNWHAPRDSRLCNEWLHWSLASLCENLKQRGVDVRLGG